LQAALAPRLVDVRTDDLPRQILEDRMALKARDDLAALVRCRQERSEPLLGPMDRIALRDLLERRMIGPDALVPDRLELGGTEEDVGEEEPAFVEIAPLLIGD